VATDSASRRTCPTRRPGLAAVQSGREGARRGRGSTRQVRGEDARTAGGHDRRDAGTMRRRDVQVAHLMGRRRRQQGVVTDAEGGTPAGRDVEVLRRVGDVRDRTDVIDRQTLNVFTVYCSCKLCVRSRGRRDNVALALLFVVVLHIRFYRAMLCIRGTSHGPLSVRLSVTSLSSTKT